MKMSDYLFCYDVADKVRLNKISRELKNKALRIQKSVFLLTDYEGDPRIIVDELLKMLQLQEDDLRVYKFLGKSRVHIGSAALGEGLYLL